MSQPIDLDQALLYLTSQCLHNKGMFKEEELTSLANCLRTILECLAARTPDSSIPILSRSIRAGAIMIEIRSTDGCFTLEASCLTKKGDAHVLFGALISREHSVALAKPILAFEQPDGEENDKQELH